MTEMPQFTIVSSGRRRVTGHVSATHRGSETWVSNDCGGYLLGDSTLIAGWWRADGRAWTFTPEKPSDLSQLSARRVWDILDDYWGERAELVLDTSREWCRVRFEPSDSIRSTQPGVTFERPAVPGETVVGELVERGWDHEHCSICWETIDSSQPEGYVSQPEAWVCGKCFAEYVERRSLGFISGT
jgi:hypothetical protein